MAEMEGLAEREGVPIVAWETGRLLASLARSLDPRVLEVGTAIGYSALHMAEVLDRGRITSLERDPARIGQARSYLQRANVEEKVEVVEGDALETIAGLRGPFDLLFLDATKGEYREYLRRAETLLAPRALLVVDNVLMSGQVAEPEAGGRWGPDAVAAQRDFNEELLASEDWLASVLAVGDGVLVASRTQR